VNQSVKTVVVEQHGDVLSLTLNAPSKANSLSPAMVEELMQALDKAEGVRIASIRGAGKHFCAGFDLSDIETLSDGDLLWRFVRIEMLLQKVHKSRFPIVALGHGQIVGAGADLFAACWRRIATPEARIRMPGWNFELALGTRRLRQLVGADHARDILIDTRSVSSDEAVEIGLATEIVDAEQWHECLDRIAARARSLPAFAASEMLRLTQDNTDDVDLAAVVRTAGRPGLKQRIIDYREAAMHAARKK